MCEHHVDALVSHREAGFAQVLGLLKRAELKAMCEKLLANTVIEDYRVEIV